MDDVRDPLFGSGLQREAVVCALCGKAWDDRVVTVSRDDEPPPSFCAACLLTTSHGEPFPDDPAFWARDALPSRDA